MQALFDKIEALIRGEYDLYGEGLLAAAADLECAAARATDDLYAIGEEFADMLIEGIIDIGEDYDDGTPEEGAEYTRRIKELYEKARNLM